MWGGVAGCPYPYCLTFGCQLLKLVQRWSCPDQTTSKGSKSLFRDLKEKFFILYHPEMAEINKRSETFSACPHKKSFLLIKKPRGRPPKKSPGSWNHDLINLFMSISQSVLNFGSLRIAYWHETLSSNKVMTYWLRLIFI